MSIPNCAIMGAAVIRQVTLWSMTVSLETTVEKFLGVVSHLTTTTQNPVLFHVEANGED